MKKLRISSGAGSKEQSHKPLEQQSNATKSKAHLGLNPTNSHFFTVLQENEAHLFEKESQLITN